MVADFYVAQQALYMMLCDLLKAAYWCVYKLFALTLRLPEGSTFLCLPDIGSKKSVR